MKVKKPLKNCPITLHPMDGCNGSVSILIADDDSDSLLKCVLLKKLSLLRLMIWGRGLGVSKSSWIVSSLIIVFDFFLSSVSF